MKRLFFLSVFALMSVVAMAGSLKTTSGDVAVLRESANATYEINLANATWEKKKDFKTWCEEDYDTRVASMNRTFASAFNLYNEGLKISDEAPKYKLLLTITNFERKQGMGLWGSCYIRMYGTLDVIDLSTNQTVCSITIKGQGGDTDFVENDRFPKTIDALCKQLSKLKK